MVQPGLVCLPVAGRKAQAGAPAPTSWVVVPARQAAQAVATMDKETVQARLNDPDRAIAPGRAKAPDTVLDSALETVLDMEPGTVLDTEPVADRVADPHRALATGPDRTLLRAARALQVPPASTCAPTLSVPMLAAPTALP